MANLSHLLGNVYGDEPAAEPTDDPSPDDAPAESHRTHEESDSVEGAVEETPSTDDAPSREGPDWASEERLDAAFGDWTAGEMPEMERDEREALEARGEVEADGDDDGEVEAEVEAEAESVRSVAAGELSSAPSRPVGQAPEGVRLQDFSGVAESPAPEAPSAPVDDQLEGPRWELTDDDILPARRGGLLSLLRRG